MGHPREREAIEDVEPTSEEDQQRARRTVAQTAVRLGADAADTRQVLAMLGLLPDAPAAPAEPARTTRIAASISAVKARRWLNELKRVTTLKSIAEECGVARSTLSDIANGVIVNIMPETERAILAVSGVGVAAPV